MATSFFLEMAQLVATWSKDPNTKVGAVIVSPERKIVSTGYNGLASGIDDDKAIDRKWKIKRVLHAEMNALANSHSYVRGCILFVTHPPCNDCAKHIASFGIKAVVFIDNADIANRWDFSVSEEIFQETGVLWNAVVLK